MNDKNKLKNILIVVLLLMIFALFYLLLSESKTDDIATVDEDVLIINGEESETVDIIDNEKPAPNKKYVPKEVTTAPPTPVTLNPEPAALDPGITVVTYSDSGFLPPVVEVTAGDSVTFINSSSKPMWVTSEDHPTAKAQVYQGFDQGKSVPKGGTYNFSFLKVGVWGYKNLNLDTHLGAVSVVPQQ